MVFKYPEKYHKGHWRGVLVFSLICAWTNGRANSRNVGDLRRHRALLWRHCNVPRTVIRHSFTLKGFNDINIFPWYIKRQTGMFPGLFIKCRKHTCTEGYTGNSKQPRDIIREWPQCQLTNLELYSLNRSCHKISWSLEAARYGFRFFQSF